MEEVANTHTDTEYRREPESSERSPNEAHHEPEAFLNELNRQRLVINN